jgi:alpha-mannosidase
LFGNEISALCSHEQLIRLMYPAFRLKRKYGAQILTGSITDVPGLSWGLPTVLSGAGVKYFFAGLPTYFEWGRNDIHTFWDESAILRHGRPDAFHWQGPDGQTVLVYYQGSYGFFNGVTGPHSYKDVMDRLPSMLDTIQKRGSEFDVIRYIHNGVDNHPPEVKISHIVREWNSKWAYPKLLVATNSMFFEALEKQCGNIRTFKGELPHTDYVVGAVSTAKETAINRIAHDKLHSAEKSATVASIVSDYSYPAEKIRTAYDNMMLYDEHTWGKAYPAGEEQDWAWNEKSHYAYKAAGLSEAILSGSLRRIADKVELKEQGRHIVVFNTLSFARTDVVRVTRFDAREPFELIDEQTGHKLSSQIVELDGALAAVPYAAHRHARGQFEQHELFDLVFIAEDVPPLGCKTYRLLSKEQGDSNQGGVAVSVDRLENRFFSVTIDPQSGAIESIYDKELSREIVDKNAPHKLNQLVARWVQSGKLESQNKAEVRKGQSGPVYGSVVVSSEGPGCPQLTQEIILYDKIKRIDLSNRVLKDSTPLLEIYFAFPFKINNPNFRFEGSNSVIEPLRDQFPGSNSNYYAVQHWANVSDGEIGVTLSAIESHLLEFGGLWPCYVSQAHHGFTPPDFGREFVKPDEIKKGHMYAFVLDSNFRTNFQPVQQGDMLFRYSITAHTAKWREGRHRDFGWAVGNPLIPVLVHGKRQGTLEPQMSFCQVDKPNVFLLTLKQAEDGDGIIVRLIETEGKEVAATVTLPHLTVKKAYLTNLVEENKGEATFTPHSIEAHLKAFGITTIRIRTS